MTQTVKTSLSRSPLQFKQNQEILETNKSKKTISIISNLYKVDARTIQFQKAKEELIKKNADLVLGRMQKQGNSRGLISLIQYEENLRRLKEKQLEMLEE
jgi:hypothetical protein